MADADVTALHTEQQRERWIAFLRLQQLPLDAKAEPYRKVRSEEQNAFLWRAVYQPLVEVAGFSKDEWHTFFCGERFGWIEHTKPGGKSISLPARTTTVGLDGKRDVLNPDEFRDFVDWVEMQAAQRGAFVTEEWNG